MARYTEVQRAFHVAIFLSLAAVQAPSVRCSSLAAMPTIHHVPPLPSPPQRLLHTVHTLSCHLSIVHKAATTTILTYAQGTQKRARRRANHALIPGPIPEQMSNKIASDLHFHHFRRILV